MVRQANLVGSVYLHTGMDHFSRAARTIAQECSCARIRQASRFVTRIYDEHLKPTGLQDSQLSVLVGVAMFGEAGARIGPLARALVLDRTTLTRNVGPLSKAGYLKVSRSRSDGRSRVITLTRSGERLIERAFPLWQQAQASIAQALGPRSLQSLGAALGPVIKLAEEGE
jgi:DNA-binding MarR family transcriptional regulator